MQKKHMIAVGAGIAALVIMTASASALITRETVTEKPAITKTVSKTETRERVAVVDPAPATPPITQQPQQQPACDDGNIAGTVLGGAAGGIVGSQIGSGNGQTAATIGGVVGGALLGREYIPTRNVTCR